MRKPTMLQNLRRQIKSGNQVRYNRWQDELRALKLEDIRRKTPLAFEASGGYSMKIKPYEDRTTNGLTRCILDFLEFKGHWATRVNVQGQPRIKKIPKYSIFSGQVEYSEKVTYTKSATKLGVPDVDSIINGCAAKIEVKAGKDRIRKEQTEQGEKIKRAGGFHFVAHDFPSFREWYKQFE